MKFALIIIFVVLTVESTAKPRMNNDLKTGNTEKSKPHGIGISAWGLVCVILIVILMGVGTYYIIMMYPMFCKRERTYDRIELAAI